MDEEKGLGQVGAIGIDEEQLRATFEEAELSNLTGQVLYEQPLVLSTETGMKITVIPLADIGNRLRSLRKNKKLTLKQVAQQTGVGVTTLSRLERGLVNNTKLSTIQAVETWLRQEQVFSIRPFFRWYDLWVGAYIDRPNRTVYVCPLPMVGLKIVFPGVANG